MRGNLHLIGVGGGGINITIDVYAKLQELGKEFSLVDINLIDTTDKTIQAYAEHLPVFTRISSTKSSGEVIDGAGGERKNKEYAKDYNTNVRQYLDKLTAVKKNDYYAVIFTGGGGTGSVAGPLLVKAMLEKEMNIIPIVVGDSSTLLHMINTSGTLATLHGFTRSTGSATAAVYYNNTVDKVTSSHTEADVNNKVFKTLAVLSAFVSGNVRDIDHQDMNNFFNPAKYESFEVDPGLYTIGVSKGVLDDDKTVMGRTMISSNMETTAVRVPLLFNKVGIAGEGISSYFDEFPLLLLFRKGVLNEEMGILKGEIAAIEHIRKTDSGEFENFGEMDDDLGIVT